MMSDKRIATVQLKQETKQRLDKIIEEMKWSFKNGFSISALIKNKRGISYEEEIIYLAEFYSECIRKFKKLNLKEKEKSIIRKVLDELEH